MHGGLGVAGDSVAEETASQRPPEPFRGNRQQIGRLFTRLGGITGTALARIRPPSARGCPGVLAAGRRDHVRCPAPRTTASSRPAAAEPGLRAAALVGSAPGALA